MGCMSFPWILGRGFFLHGSVLEDGVTLESPLDLDLVLLQCAEVPQEQVEHLAQAATRGVPTRKWQTTAA